MIFPAETAPDDAVDLTDSVAALREAREVWRRKQAGRHGRSVFPVRDVVGRAVELLSAALFPSRLGGFEGPVDGEDDFVAGRLRDGLALLQQQIAREFDYWQIEAGTPFDPNQPAIIVRHFATTLAQIRILVDGDVEAAFLGDPAARSVDEILICYPGALAVLHHRIAHALHMLGVPIVARIISEIANSRTGIDIHPGATIGPSFFIDHGTGVVIGETAVIGARVQLYQHVTLGARSPLGAARVTARDRFVRHPIIEDDVVIYAGATILGPVTIGRGSTIGGNVWLLEDVPAGSVVVQPTAAILDGRAANILSDTLLGLAR